MTKRQTDLEAQVNALWRALQANPASTRLRETYQRALRAYRLTVALQTGRAS